MSHPLLGQSCDRGEEIIGRSPLQERYADMQSGTGVIRATRTNPRLPSCPRDPSRRLHPLRELSSVPVETSPTPASSLESGTSFVGEALNFEGPIPKDHLTEEADSQGESVETGRDSDGLRNRGRFESCKYSCSSQWTTIYSAIRA
ncbi:hypothetical protein OUZ56_021666 [Daphnia magna]|uniref:Uncharacterized protein n=1 Tax=Daphnia magna TaxID=35525 RepID=A0ABR0AU50_9CRUS|nr:hypothetical protein OUZ56_021666 [Daphnia magna]